MTVERIQVRPDFDLCRMPKGNWQIADDHSDRKFSEQAINNDLAMYVDAGIDTFVCGDIYAGVEERLGKFRKFYRQLRGMTRQTKLKC